MESHLAHILALKLMNNHHLLLKGWVFEFDRGKVRLGLCKYTTKKISFSINYLPLIDEEEFTNVILHEIAHALVGGGNGHNSIWRNKAIEIGCNGKRLYEGCKRIDGKYVAVCPSCERKHYRHRISRQGIMTSCGYCSDGKFNPKYTLKYKETF